MSSRPSPRPATAVRPVEEPRTIRDLLAYRIHRLPNALSRGAALRYRAEFGVSVMEWRILALLGAFQPLTMKRLAREAGIDKSQASRAVTGRVARGLVQCLPGENDGREVSPRLSPGGERLQRGLMRAAPERDAAFRAALGEAERAMFKAVLDRLESAGGGGTVAGRHAAGTAAGAGMTVPSCVGQG